MSRAAPDWEPLRELPADAPQRLALPSAWWLRILVTLERDFGRVPVFVDARGTPRVFVVGDEDRIAVMFATVPETVLASMPGQRACEVVGHPAFAPGSRNGGRLIVEAIAAAAPDEPAHALVLTFDLPLDVTGTRWMDDLARRESKDIRGGRHGWIFDDHALDRRPSRSDAEMARARRRTGPDQGGNS